MTGRAADVSSDDVSPAPTAKTRSQYLALGERRLPPLSSATLKRLRKKRVGTPTTPRRRTPYKEAWITARSKSESAATAIPRQLLYSPASTSEDSSQDSLDWDSQCDSRLISLDPDPERTLNRRPLLRSSTSGTFLDEMGEPTVETLRQRSMVAKCLMQCTDDIETINPNNVTIPFLIEANKKAEEIRRELQKSCAELMMTDVDYYKKNVEALAKKARNTCSQFIASAQEVLKDATVPTSTTTSTDSDIEARREATRKIKANRVATYTESTVDELTTLTEQINDFCVSENCVETDHDFTKFEDKCERYKKQVKSITQKACSLLNDAETVGLATEAEELEAGQKALHDASQCMEGTYNSLKDKLEMYGPAVDKYSSITIPTFSGEDGDSLDYFSFKLAFEQYLEVKPTTKNGALKLLLTACLTGVPRSSCEHMTSTDQVFEYLKDNYGNPSILLIQKSDEVRAMGACTGSSIQMRAWAMKVRSKLSYVLKLAQNHSITGQLFHSSLGLDIRKLLPNSYQKAFMKYLADEHSINMTDEDLFNALLSWMDKFVTELTFDVRFNKNTTQTELKPSVKEKTVNKPKQQQTTKKFVAKQVGAAPANIPITVAPLSPANEMDCELCKAKHTYLYYCPEFQKAKPRDRYKMTGQAKCCFRCLRLDSLVDLNDRKAWFERHESNCSDKWACKVKKCGDRANDKQVNMLLCGFHYHSNKNLEKDLINDLDKSKLKSGMKFFFTQPMYNLAQLQQYPTLDTENDETIELDVLHPSVFLLQTIIVNQQELLIFYDSGCHGATISERAANILETQCLRPGPSWIQVAGGEAIRVSGGDERFKLPLADSKKNALITGLKMPHITTPFPSVDVQQALEDLKVSYQSSHPDGPELPPVSRYVAGREVDVMLGIRYLKYFPKLLHMMSTGLSIYSSMFATDGGVTVGVIGGPHSSFGGKEDDMTMLNSRQYFTNDAHSYVSQPEQLILPVFQEKFNESEHYNYVSSQLGCYDNDEDHGDDFNPDQCCQHAVLNIKEDGNRFDEVENLGQEADYRCVKCRSCADCKKGDILEKVSLKEEVEQFLIESSVELDVERKKLVTKLPFIKSPTEYLSDNSFIADRIFKSQLKLIEKTPEMRSDVLKFHEKLRSKGFVCALDQLPADQQKLVLSNHDAGFTIPWRVVFKETSLSTPCRMVYDGSSKCPNGKESLNGVLAKGKNTLPKLLHILIRFRRYFYALTADIKTAYNQTEIVPEHFRYQKYLWKEGLMPDQPTKVMVVKTLIYGIRPSGAITTAGLVKVADYSDAHYPQHHDGAEILRRDTYVDDLISAQPTKEKNIQASQSIKTVLGLASMDVKGITAAHEKPCEEVSGGSHTVGLVGLVWDPERDVISLDIKPLFFGKPRCGKLPQLVEGDIGEALQGNFSRRTLLGKVAAVYDPLGMVTPITSRLKLDLHQLCAEKLDWDDRVPDKYLATWVRNIEDIQSLKTIEFRRSLIHPDSVNNQLDVIISADASKTTSACCVHTRSKLRTGEYFVQLLCAKSKLATELTVPRAELKACRMAAVLGAVVTTNLGDQVQSVTFVTDSSISLHWISNDERQLETAVRNAVIEIRRHSQVDSWYHIESAENIADLPTRDATIPDISEDSAWQNGPDWMRLERNDWPVNTIGEITLSSEQRKIAASESKAEKVLIAANLPLQDKLTARYNFSKYLYDPVRLPWNKSIRVVAYVLKFIRKILPTFTRIWIPKAETHTEDIVHTVSSESLELSIVQLSEFDIKVAENYYFFVGTKEVQKFAKTSEYKDSKLCDDGILYYTARIMENDKLKIENDGMWDLETLSFCKPIIDRFSPIAYSVMIYVHESICQHGNVAHNLRESRSISFILHGRNLAIEVREDCAYCHRRKAKTLDREMGKIHESRLCIAPPFFYVQVDLFGPYSASCEHQHRAKVQIWGVVFKDPASGAIAVHAMQSYSTAAFLQAYTRFSSRVGHPTKMYIDGGGQLVKAVNDMQINITDVTNTLNSRYAVGVEHEICPPGAHHMHGIVERSIKEVKKLFDKIFGGLKLDLFGYETAFLFIANEINNIPLCIGSKTDNLDDMDLITPSRLLLGRNNRRALGGHARIDSPSRLMQQMDNVYDAWWECWKNGRIADFIPASRKWSRSDGEVNVDDIVIFLKLDKAQTFGTPVWKIGRVVEVHVSKDGVVRQAKIQYKNPGEAVFRETQRSVRQLAVLAHEGHLDLLQRLQLARQEAELVAEDHKPAE